MDVVGHAADAKAFAVDAAYDGCEIGVEIFAYRSGEDWCAVPGAENKVNE